MPWDEKEDLTIYKAVVNHEEQYSIWPVDRENPLGWNDAGKSGSKSECLAYIKEIWTDMRPLSLRKRMEELAKQQTKLPRGQGCRAEQLLEEKSDIQVERSQVHG